MRIEQPTTVNVLYHFRKHQCVSLHMKSCCQWQHRVDPYRDEMFEVRARLLVLICRYEHFKIKMVLFFDRQIQSQAAHVKTRIF